MHILEIDRVPVVLHNLASRLRGRVFVQYVFIEKCTCSIECENVQVLKFEMLRLQSIKADAWGENIIEDENIMLHDYSIISLYAIRCIRAKIAVFAEIRNTHARKKSGAQVIRQLSKTKAYIPQVCTISMFSKKAKDCAFQDERLL